MKAGRTLEDLAKELDRQRNAKRDFLAGEAGITMSPKATLQLGQLGEFMIAGTGHEHLAQKTSIPKKYYDRMLTADPSLLSINVNTWLHEDPQTRLVRTLDNEVRGYMGERYRPLDNYDLAEILIPKFSEMGAQITSCEITERRMYIKATTPRLEGDVRVGQVVQGGIVAKNSEIGFGALSIESLLFELRCLNGWIMGKPFRKTHVGKAKSVEGIEEAAEYYTDKTKELDDAAFWSKVRDTVDHVLSEDAFNEVLRKMQQGTEKPIEKNPIECVEVFSKRMSLTQEEHNGVLTALMEGRDYTAFGLGAAVTRASQDVPDYERATELEALGGKVLELGPSDWRAIAG